MSKTKIVIVQLKEIIYTGIFIGLGLLLILLLLIMFRPGSDDSKKTPVAQSEALYHAGVYTTQVNLGQNSMNLEVTLDSNHINSVRFVNLEESVATMYPLMESSLDEISNQLKSGVDLENVVLSSENPYTEQLLMEAISETIAKAKY